MIHCEGKARFEIGDAFYNPKSKLVRDLGVLAALVYKQQQGQLRVLEAMSGSGIRSLRYYLESNADFLWINEGNYQLNALLNRNLQTVIPDEHPNG